MLFSLSILPGLSNDVLLTLGKNPPRHETRGMDQHAVQLRRVGKAIPIHLLHLPRLIGMEEEVAARGAPRERQGGACIDDAGSGHRP